MNQSPETKVVHWQQEPYDVYIGRPGPWGNPFRLDGDRKEAIRQYREWIMYHDDAQSLRDEIHTLRGKTLGCWCKPKACHGDVLAELANNNIMEILTFDDYKSIGIDFATDRDITVHSLVQVDSNGVLTVCPEDDE